MSFLRVSRGLRELGERGCHVGDVLPRHRLPDGLRRPHLLLGALAPLLHRPLLHRLYGVLVRLLLRAMLRKGVGGRDNRLINFVIQEDRDRVRGSTEVRKSLCKSC